MTSCTSVCTSVVVVVVVLVASTCIDASSVLLHPDASLSLLPEQEGELHHSLHNLSHISPSFSALQDTEYGDNGGFFLDEFEAVTRSDTLECPSANVITTRYKCQVKDQWVDCYRRHCCQGYNFVAGRCLPDSVDPCTQNFCEQKCSVYFGRVICTCFSGYRFSPENHKRGIQPVCLDIDECASGTGICQHECINEPGSFKCSCRPGYRLRGDNTTCELESEGGAVPSPRQWEDPLTPQSAQARTRAHTRDQGNQCSASCASVGQMTVKIRSLEEKIDALSTAVRLYSFAAGLPGPEGPPGPPGAAGSRGFPGPSGSTGPPGEKGAQGPPWKAPPKTTNPPLPNDEPFTEEDFPLDSWTVISGQGRRKFCRCRRGAVGPPGAYGKAGPRGLPGIPGVPGEKGDPGSFDFLNLMIADVRHDIQKLQEKVFGDDRPEPYDLAGALARGEVSQAAWQKQYHSQLQEIMTEEHDNSILGTTNRFHPHFLRHGGEKQEGETPSNAAAMTEASKIPPPTPRPLTSQVKLMDLSPEDSIIQEQLLIGDHKEDSTDNVPDGYYDALHAHDDLLLEEYIAHYDYNQLPEVNYISDYALDAPIPSSQIFSFSPSRTFNSAGPSVTTVDHHHEGLPHPTQSHARASPGRRSLPDDLTLANGEKEGQVYDQSENVSTNLFSSQGSEETLESKKIQPTMTLGTRNSLNPLNIDTTPSRSLRSTTSPSTASHTNYHDYVLAADGSSAAGRDSNHDSGQGNEKERSSWQYISNWHEARRGNDRQLTSQKGNVRDDGEANSNKDTNSSASVSEINKSRLKETEKLIEILDDILREVNITEQISRIPRYPEDSQYYPRGRQYPSIPPHAPRNAPSSNTKEGDTFSTSTLNTQGFKGSQSFEKVTSGPIENVPAKSTLMNAKEAASPTHSVTRGVRGGKED